MFSLCRLKGLRFWGLWQSKGTSWTVKLLLTWTVLPKKQRASCHETWTCSSRGPSMPTLYTAETMATLKASAKSNFIYFYVSAVFRKSKFSGCTDLSYKDFRQALQGFTPPSLWGLSCRLPPGPAWSVLGDFIRHVSSWWTSYCCQLRYASCCAQNVHFSIRIKGHILNPNWAQVQYTKATINNQNYSSNCSLRLMKTWLVETLRCL